MYAAGVLSSKQAVLLALSKGALRLSAVMRPTCMLILLAR